MPLCTTDASRDTLETRPFAMEFICRESFSFQAAYVYGLRSTPVPCTRRIARALWAPRSPNRNNSTASLSQKPTVPSKVEYDLRTLSGTRYEDIAFVSGGQSRAVECLNKSRGTNNVNGSTQRGRYLHCSVDHGAQSLLNVRWKRLTKSGLLAVGRERGIYMRQSRVVTTYRQQLGFAKFDVNRKGKRTMKRPRWHFLAYIHGKKFTSSDALSFIGRLKTCSRIFFLRISTKFECYKIIL